MNGVYRPPKTYNENRQNKKKKGLNGRLNVAPPGLLEIAPPAQQAKQALGAAQAASQGALPGAAQDEQTPTSVTKMIIVRAEAETH